MYRPAAFRIDDQKKISEFIAANSFGMLITCHRPEPSVVHLPFRPVIQDGVCRTLCSHMARANPQWKHFEESSDALVVLTGPHAYVSPSWYLAEHAVPTWNYTAVHVHGKARILRDQAEVSASLKETVDHFESSFETPWRENLPTELHDRMIQQIVAFEIDVIRMEGKFKLSQNRPQQDRDRVAQRLNESSDPMGQQVANWMFNEGISQPPDVAP